MDGKEEAKWLSHGEKGVSGFLRFVLGNICGTYTPNFMLRHLAKIGVGAYKEALISQDFKNKSLVPIFFSHGLTCAANYYSRYYIDFVSHGFIVFAICHLDNSCLYTITRDGKDMYHGPRTSKYLDNNWNLRSEQLKIRENEISELIDEICDTDLL